MLLEINDLSISFPNPGGSPFQAVRGISMQIAAGEVLGLVGESGSGKSATALSIMRLLPDARLQGEMLLSVPDRDISPTDLLKLPETAMRHYRGKGVAMVFQEPMTSLNPVLRCGPQVAEAVLLHHKVSAAEARDQALALFEQVKLPDPIRVYQAYPHQLSGGQKQRVMIAMALAGHPALLLADEPTTALDANTQRAILDLLKDLRAELGMAMLFISHDLGVIAEMADRTCVMQAGQIVETGPTAQILQAPQHPYTRGLVACRPTFRRKVRRLPTIQDFQTRSAYQPAEIGLEDLQQRRAALYQQRPVLEVQGLQVRYPVRKNWLGQPIQWLDAVDQIDFEVFPGEIFGIAGTSGCGKTTLGRAVCRLATAANGSVRFQGTAINALAEAELLPFRRDIQMVFQDPYASLNPQKTAGEALMEPMEIHKLHGNSRARRDKCMELLETVGLDANHFSRLPHALSGGQRQRVCLARALALEPKMLICDEIVSALDVSVQATVLNLLLDLRDRYGLTYIFISHDLNVVAQMCDRIMVMREGKMEASGYPEALFTRPENPYVRQLIAAIPGERPE